MRVGGLGRRKLWTPDPVEYVGSLQWMNYTPSFTTQIKVIDGRYEAEEQWPATRSLEEGADRHDEE